MSYIKVFLEYLQANHYSKSTVKAYEYLLKNMRSYFTKRGIGEVEGINEDKINEYLKTLKTDNCQSRYYIIKVQRITKYFRFLEDESIIFYSPIRDVDLRKPARHSYPTLSKNEIENILSSINTGTTLGVKAKAILELAYSSALRPREIYNLKTTDIDFKNGILFIEQSKNRKDRKVPVGETALYWIKKYIEEVRPGYIKAEKHGYVFINHKTGGKLTRYGIRSAIQRTLAKNKLPPVKPYSLRSTAATALLLNGMSIAYISALLGHSDIRTTQIYLKVKTHQLKQVLLEHHPRKSFGSV